MFKSKHEVRDYLDRYATMHNLHPSISYGERVLELQHEPELDSARPWRVQTSKGEYRVQRVVVATGLNREPHVPHFDGSSRFAQSRELTHSWHVSSCERFRGKRVLLVGSGNSAAELAVALHEAGAEAIDMLVDGPRHFLRRSTLGKLFAAFPLVGLSVDGMVHELHMCTFEAATPAPPAPPTRPSVAGAVAITAGCGREEAAKRRAAEWAAFQESHDWFIHLLSVDLSAHGLAKPPKWADALHAVVAPRIPVYDVDDTHGRRSGVIDLIQAGRVHVRRGRIRRFHSRGVVVDRKSKHAAATAAGPEAGYAAVGAAGAAHVDAAADAGAPCDTLEYDAVILATGFTHRLHDFLCGHEALLGAPGTTPSATPSTTPSTPAAAAAASPSTSAVVAAATAPLPPSALTERTPLVTAGSRSTAVDSLYLVGFDQFRSTLSIGPLLGYRGYDVGAAIARDLYGPPPASAASAVGAPPRPYPSLPADEQGESSAASLLSPRHAAVAVGAGIVLGVLGSVVGAARGRRAPGAAVRTLAAVRSTTAAKGVGSQ